MLVYDATSTPSFLQLIRWHSELEERVRRSSKGNIGGGRVGITVVANKLDRVEAAETVYRNGQLARRSKRRDVLGLGGRSFHGKDSHYEYSVAASAGTTPSNATNNRISTTSNTNNNASTLDNTPTRRTTNRRKNYNSGGTVQTLSYGPGVGGQLMPAYWSTDLSYLDCLKRAEDCSFPDRNMVQLWCRRNNLHFVEVSAMDGTGVDYAVESTAEMAMMNGRGVGLTDGGGVGGIGVGVNDGRAESYYEWKDKGVDFYERYGREDSCFRLLSCFSRIKRWRR